MNDYNCPRCGTLSQWRRGVGFDHELKCPCCGLSFDPAVVAANRHKIDEFIGERPGWKLYSVREDSFQAISPGGDLWRVFFN